MWAPIAPPRAVVAVSIASPVVGSPVDKNAAPAARFPAASPMFSAFFPGRLSGLLGRIPCSFPNATAEPALHSCSLRIISPLSKCKETTVCRDACSSKRPSPHSFG